MQERACFALRVPHAARRPSDCVDTDLGCALETGDQCLQTAFLISHDVLYPIPLVSGSRTNREEAIETYTWCIAEAIMQRGNQFGSATPM